MGWYGEGRKSEKDERRREEEGGEACRVFPLSFESRGGRADKSLQKVNLRNDDCAAILEALNTYTSYSCPCVCLSLSVLHDVPFKEKEQLM